MTSMTSSKNVQPSGPRPICTASERMATTNASWIRRRVSVGVRNTLDMRRNVYRLLRSLREELTTSKGWPIERSSSYFGFRPPEGGTPSPVNYRPTAFARLGKLCGFDRCDRKFDAPATFLEQAKQLAVKHEPLIQIKDVDVTLDGHRVLSRISWRLLPDEHWVFVGPNGSGKSTLLKLIRGELWPDPAGHGSRTYALDGEAHPSPIGVREKISLVSPGL